MPSYAVNNPSRSREYKLIDLLLVSRQVHHEARDVLFNRFTILCGWWRTCTKRGQHRFDGFDGYTDLGLIDSFPQGVVEDITSIGLPLAIWAYPVVDNNMHFRCIPAFPYTIEDIRARLPKLRSLYLRLELNRQSEDCDADILAATICAYTDAWLDGSPKVYIQLCYKVKSLGRVGERPLTEALRNYVRSNVKVADNFTLQ